MQKWEYYYCSFSRIDVLAGNVINVNKMRSVFTPKKADGKTVQDYLDFIGSLGWELVSTVGCEPPSGDVLYTFKRPIQE